MAKLPEKIEWCPDSAKEILQERIARFNAGPKPIKVLIIDDSDEDRFLLKLKLERYPCEVDEAAKGNEGIEKILANNYAFVFLDLAMPGGMDGVEVIQRVRSTTPNPPDCILIVTSVHLYLIEKAIALGPLITIPKPVRDEDLEFVLKREVSP